MYCGADSRQEMHITLGGGKKGGEEKVDVDALRFAAFDSR